MRIDASLRHDFPPPSPASRPQSYVICATPRCGSTLLARAFLATGQLGVPAEYFNRGAHLPGYIARFGTDNLPTLVEKIKEHRTSPNGVFGFKAQYDQFHTIISKISLDEHFPDLKFIMITRRDLLFQAISYLRAQQTGAWTSEHPSSGRPSFNLGNLVEAMEFIQSRHVYWDRLLAALGVSPLRISYEELCVNPSNTVTKVFRLLDIPGEANISLGETGLQLQRNSESFEWAKRFQQHFELLRRSGEDKAHALDELGITAAGEMRNKLRRNK